MVFNAPSKLEAFIELVVEPNKKKEDKKSNDLGASTLVNDLIKEKRKDIIKTYSEYQEAIEKIKNVNIPEPKLEPVNSVTYWNVVKKKDEFKFCPFRFDNDGGMLRCVGHTCMAYMVDSDDCSHYCARLRKGE